jgi:hypothetical protein
VGDRADCGGWFNQETGELCPGYPIGTGDIVVDVSTEALARAHELMRGEPGAGTAIQSDGNPLPLPR